MTIEEIEKALARYDEELQVHPVSASQSFAEVVRRFLPIVKAAQEFTVQAKNYEYHPWHYMYREGSDSYVCLACGQIEEIPHLEDCAAIALEIAIKQLEGQFDER